MKRTLILGGLLTAMAATAAVAEDASLPLRVEQAIQARVEAGEYPALVVATIDGESSAVRSWGKLDDGRAPDADTLFEIGSITKTFTATLLAQAVKNGKLQLDTPVATLLPGFTLPERNGAAITLGMLAEQDSGLPRLPGNLAPVDITDPYADYDAAKLRAFLADYTLTRDPGASFEYSNLGYGLLGHALATHAGTDYATLLHKQVLAPLGMNSSGTTLPSSSHVRLARGHDPDGKPVPNWNFDVLAGAGAIRSTGADMLRYLAANLGTLDTPLSVALRFAQAPRRAVGASEHIGLGWMTRHTPHGDITWHNGMTGGYASFIGFDARTRHGVVVLVNAQRSVDDLGFALLGDDTPLTSPRKAVAMDAAALNAYTGTYRLAPGFDLVVFRLGDSLQARATGQGAFEILPSGDDAFFARAADIRIDFHRDANGDIDALTLHQAGHDSKAPRIADAEAPPQTVTLDADTLRQYVGHYQLAPGAVFDVSLDKGQLTVKLAAQPSLPVYASARDAFFYTAVDAQIRFERDADGAVNALVLHQNGVDQRATRLP